MITLDSFLTGFLQVMDVWVILFIVLGTILGILFGAAPGLTASTAIAMFLPITFGMEANAAFAFLLAIYCAGLYAGSIPAILISTPGAPGNAATVMDGYPMCQSGRAGRALTLSVMASCIGGLFSALCLFFLSPVISSFALKFGPPEYFAISLMGITCVASVTGKDTIKGLTGTLLGLTIAMIGMDPVSGNLRFTFGQSSMITGVGLIPVLVGLFAMPEVFAQTENIGRETIVKIQEFKTDRPRFAEYWSKKVLLVKSSIIGTIVGAIPGTGSTIASWFAYNEAKRTSKTPEEFGKGSAEGIVACESANNAVTGGALIPLITLGIPGDGVAAMLLGALTVQGLAPGPLLLVDHSEILTYFLWVLILSNILMTVMGLYGSKYAPKILSIPFRYLSPFIVVFCAIGAYSSANSFFDVKAMIVLGFLGYVLKKVGFPAPTIALGFVLGSIVEFNLVRSLIVSHGNPLIFFQKPVSLTIIILTVLMTFLMFKRTKTS